MNLRTKDVRFNRDDGNHISIIPHMVNQKNEKRLLLNDSEDL